MEVLIPKLRFHEFKDNWILKKLNEISKIYDGTHQTPEYVDLGVPFYSVEHVTANQFENTKFISEDVFEKENKRVKLEKGDILMTRIGSIGVTKYIDWDVNASFYVSLALLKVKKNYNSEFVNHFITSPFFQSELWKRTIHVAFPQKINLGEIGDCMVILPSIEEQLKIANFLSLVDKKINLLTRKKTLLEKYRKGVMQKIFNQEIRFKDDNGDDYDDWIEVTVNEISTFENGKAHENEIDENGEYIVVNSKFISTNGIVKKYTNNIICGLEKNDIVMVMSDVPNGKAIAKCFYIEEDNKYTLNQRICKIKVNKNINSKYIYFLINRNPYYLAFDNGVSQTNLRKNDVLECPLFIPSSLNEQSKIADFLTAIDNKINQLDIHLEKNKAFKKGLLQQMFV